MRRCWAVGVAGLIALAAALPALAAEAGWPDYGGDPGGTRYSAADQITRDNVGKLTLAWTYHTGEAARRGAAFNSSSFEGTPILAAGKLVLCTPFDRVVALDPETGRELWTFDPGLATDLQPAAGFICRGVAVWHDPAAAAGAACATRVFLGTDDARLFAIDLASGKRCGDFGKDGEVALLPDTRPLYPGQLQVSSAPTLINDTVIVGTGGDDMSQARSPSETVRAFDARTGAPRWSFDPVPRQADDPAAASWADASYRQNAGGGAWAPISVDAARDLVFLPTAGPTASFYGGGRPGDDLYTSSVVALRGSTGAVVWHFQTTHHDVWDYDVAAQPSLVTLHRDGRDIPALVIITKMGFVFVLDRETGKPLFPVVERPFPASDVPGEKTSPTQPVPVAPPPLVRQRLTAADAWGLFYFDKLACRHRLEALDTGGLYTPPSLKGTAIFPFTGGGGNWGGGAIDPGRGLLIVNMMELIHVVRLVPRAQYAATHAANPGMEIGRELGLPYAAERYLLTSPLGVPCNPPPWSVLAAVDLNAGTIKWRVPLGEKMFGLMRGLPSVGGPIITASGLVFIAAALDHRLRAFDVETGRELWQATLPAGGEATPMTYVVNGRQFVVIAAGGHIHMDTPLGDSVLAFALPHGQ